MEDSSVGTNTSHASSSRDDNDHDSDGSELPPNREGATIDSPRSEPDHEETLAKLEEQCNYFTVSRWKYRHKLWKEKYMAEIPQVPEPSEFFFSPPVGETPLGDNVPVEHMIWGEDENSLKSLCKQLQGLQDELEGLQAELKALTEDNLDSLELSPEQAIYSDDLDDLDETTRNRILNERRAHLQQRIKDRQAHLQERNKDRQANLQERIKDRQTIIQKQEGTIQERQGRVEKQLWGLVEHYTRKRQLLSELAGKGNETVTTLVRSHTNDSNRVDKFHQVPPSEIELLQNTKADSKFLEALLNKNDIVKTSQKKDLLDLKDFMASLLHKAKRTNDEDSINNTVNAIHNWRDHSPPQKKRPKITFGRPHPTGTETKTDQPILLALVFQVLCILRNKPKMLSREQVLPAIGTTGRAYRTMDLHVDEHREFLYSLFPEILGLAIEVKPVAEDSPTGFQKNQDMAREQVIGHMAKRLLCSFDFGGIGQDDVVFGIVLSMVSVQVLELKLTGVGTDQVRIILRQTPHVPLLGEDFVPISIRDSVAWDMQSDGLLLLAMAMLDMPRDSLFGNNRDQIHRITVSAHNSFGPHQNGNDSFEFSMNSLLGSGSFAHVVKIHDDMFIKIPRSQRMVKSLIQECKVLRKLDPYQQPFFPRTVVAEGDGLFLVNLSIRNEISCMHVLPLRGMIGCSLRRYCESIDFRMPKDQAHSVMLQVYNALEYAHSKKVFHLDVRPSNIVLIPSQSHVMDVLLVDWGCGMLETDEIKDGKFVGCTPYAHDTLLGTRGKGSLKPQAAFDFASLGYTWYHVVRGVIDWHFDQPKKVTQEELEGRKEHMIRFFGQNGDIDWDLKVREACGVIVDLPLA